MKAFTTFLAAGMLITSGANATLITFDYTAKVNATVRSATKDGSLEFLPSLSFNGTTIGIGDTVRGSFTIDLDTPVIIRAPGPNPGSTYSEYRGPKDAPSKNLLVMTMDRSGHTVALKPKESGVYMSVEDGDASNGDRFVLTNNIYGADVDTSVSVLPAPSGRSLSFASK